MAKKNGSYAKLADKALKEAVKKAIDKHARMGIPSVFIKNGELCYRLPNGKIVKNAPN